MIVIFNKRKKSRDPVLSRFLPVPSRPAKKNCCPVPQNPVPFIPLVKTITKKASFCNRIPGEDAGDAFHGSDFGTEEGFNHDEQIADTNHEGIKIRLFKKFKHYVNF